MHVQIYLKFGKLGAALRHQLNGQALISGVVVSSSAGRALAMKAGDPGLSPGSANNFLGQGYWHTLTWGSRSVTRRMSWIVHCLVSKSCLIIPHPVALPPNIVGRVASGKVVVIRQLQPSGILWYMVMKVKVLLRAVKVKFEKLGAAWRHQLNLAQVFSSDIL